MSCPGVPSLDGKKIKTICMGKKLWQSSAKFLFCIMGMANTNKPYRQITQIYQKSIHNRPVSIVRRHQYCILNDMCVQPKSNIIIVLYTKQHNEKTRKMYSKAG